MPLIDAITAKCADPGFRQRVVDLLIDMCTVDTAPNPDVTVMRDREAAVFARINAYLGPGPWRLETRPVDPAIADHPAFSKLHFTKTPARPAGLSPEQAYAGRGNLLVMLDGQPDAAAGTATAINAHIDIIAPFIAPVRDGDTITGRGTIDDKGHVAAICGALKLIAELIADGDLELKNRITAMFPIEEETGGNGSLALALDRELRERYDSILVMECASRNVFPANRGAVWFRCEAALAADAGPEVSRSVADDQVLSPVSVDVGKARSRATLDAKAAGRCRARSLASPCGGGRRKAG